MAQLFCNFLNFSLWLEKRSQDSENSDEKLGIFVANFEALLSW